MSSRRQRSFPLGGRYRQVSLYLNLGDRPHQLINSLEYSCIIHPNMSMDCRGRWIWSIHEDYWNGLFMTGKTWSGPWTHADTFWVYICLHILFKTFRLFSIYNQSYSKQLTSGIYSDITIFAYKGSLISVVYRCVSIYSTWLNAPELSQYGANAASTIPCFWSSYCIHWDLVTPYCDKNIDHNCLRSWLVASWHQAITWTNVDLIHWGRVTHIFVSELGQLTTLF